MRFADVEVRMAPSRALGDFDFKKSENLSPENQMITADPDVLTHQISETDEFLVLACDGEYYIPLVEFNSFIPTKASGTV
jgi:protein phosphatase PTC2/3